MCRLLGIVANKPVDLEFSLERFKSFASWNPDGWGIGWYDGKVPNIFKQGISAVDRESKLPVLSKEVKSNIIIAHIRKGTGAEPSERNSHPFKHKNWIFAHNGQVDGDYLKTLLNLEHKQALQGETDSEIYFHWLLQCTEEEHNIVKGIRKAIKKVSERDYSGLNFLLSDGLSLYAFRYTSKWESYYSLYRLIRKPIGGGPVGFLSKETQALIRSKSLKGERALLVCSEKLSDEEWIRIDLGKLLVVKSDLSFKETRIIRDL